MPTALLKTKLFIPQARSNLVPRPRLAARLEEGLTRPLTLICAPAGYGKTTVLSAWIQNSNHRVAWLSLDEGDNDPARFWSHVIATLQKLSPGLGESARILLQSPQPPTADAILTALLNDLAALDGDATLALDDYHFIEARQVHEGFAYLLNHLPPQFHLILASRSDPPLPLTRLRARDQLNELRADDLRFTSEEADLFLEQLMGLHLSAADVTALETRTEGWIAGLQLAALSMQGQADIPGFISAFTGSNRYIVDYLIDEVLDQRSNDMLSFLLQTAILDRLSEPLCDAVTGKSGSQALLEELERANLFIVPLDEERKWYRYHHLFADVLRNRLRQTQPELMPELHQRASAWFERRGQMAEAISHALAGGDPERAASLAERSAWDMLERGEVTTLQRWLDALPAEIVSARPDLGLAYAWLCSITNRLDALATRLQALERNAERSADRSLTPMQSSQVAALRAHLAIEAGDFRGATALCRKSLAGIPESNLHMRGLVSYFLGFAEHMSGDTVAAERTFARSSAFGQATGNVMLIAHALSNQAAMQEAQGQLRQAAETYRRAIQLSSDPHGRPFVVACIPYDDLGKLLREWNELDESARLLRESIELAHRGDNIGAEINAHMSLALTSQAQGNAAGAQDALEAARQIAHQSNHEEFLEKVDVTEARLLLIQGRVDLVSRWVVARGLRANDRPDYPDQPERATLARVLIAQGRERPGEQYLVQAQRLLDWLLQIAESAGRAGHVIEVQTLQAMALQAKDDLIGARVTLQPALTLAEPEGYVRIFVDEGEPMKVLLKSLELGNSRLRAYRDRLVAVFADKTAIGPTALAIHNLVEPLNQRELEVLHCIADGLSNREIATRFFVSLSTVKWYINNLYGKLGVASRTQALARARALGLM